MSATFYGHGYECSSEPPRFTIDVLESDCWPVDDNSGSGTKDQLGNGLHPVIALGGRTAADGRPMNLTGVVISWTAGLTTATGRSIPAPPGITSESRSKDVTWSRYQPAV